MCGNDEYASMYHEAMSDQPKRTGFLALLGAFADEPEYAESLAETVRGRATQPSRPGSRGSRRYRMPARPMGVRPDVDLDRALRLAGELEDGEVSSKLAPRD
jgi:hypothetical protein